MMDVVGARYALSEPLGFAIHRPWTEEVGVITLFKDQPGVLKAKAVAG